MGYLLVPKLVTLNDFEQCGVAHECDRQTDRQTAALKQR